MMGTLERRIGALETHKRHTADLPYAPVSPEDAERAHAWLTAPSERTEPHPWEGLPEQEVLRLYLEAVEMRGWQEDSR